MRLTRCHFHTLREPPAGAEVASHRLMARAGLLLRHGSGLYTYAPLLHRTLEKIMRIVSEEMDGTGALRLLMPALQPLELWERSGRLDAYIRSGILWRASDRRDGWFALGPTHEEVITDFVARTVGSYKQLPRIYYQISDKFRDEIRPRHGLLRSREFVMKDAYSFDAGEEGLEVSYAQMRAAYCRIFARCGLEFIVVQADPGAIGAAGPSRLAAGRDPGKGDRGEGRSPSPLEVSEEFMVVAGSGEDEILHCACGRAANLEKAVSGFAAPSTAPALPMREVATPGIRTVEELCEFFPGLGPDRMVKTLLYEAALPGAAEPQVVAVLLRGDQEVNEVKLARALGALGVELAGEETVRRVSGAEVGFAGPLGFVRGRRGECQFSLRMLADETVRGMCNFLCGINRTDYHALDVNFAHDLPELEFRDLRKARAGEPCTACGEPLRSSRGIEVGHIFKLGTKYSEAMGATFLDAGGRARPFVMGCYGIGCSRVAAAAVEQNHDDKGILWPATIAPYHVHLVALDAGKDSVRERAEDTYRRLLAAGIEVLYDDRPEASAGVKFNDADLAGMPFRVTVGRRAAQGQVEVVRRASGEKLPIDAGDLVAWLAPRCLVAGRPDIRFPDPDGPE